MITWSNHDRTALNAWLNDDLGQKFLRYLEQRRPRMSGTSDDLNSFALMGARIQGYDLAIEEIDAMRQITSSLLPKAEYVDTTTD